MTEFPLNIIFNIVYIYNFRYITYFANNPSPCFIDISLHPDINKHLIINPQSESKNFIPIPINLPTSTIIDSINSRLNNLTNSNLYKLNFILDIKINDLQQM